MTTKQNNTQLYFTCPHCGCQTIRAEYKDSEWYVVEFLHYLDSETLELPYECVPKDRKKSPKWMCASCYKKIWRPNSDNIDDWATKYCDGLNSILRSKRLESLNRRFYPAKKMT